VTDTEIQINGMAHVILCVSDLGTALAGDLSTRAANRDRAMPAAQSKIGWERLL
jgi:hypothetical protein